MNSESILESRKYYQRNKILSVIRFQRNVSRYDIKKSTSYSMTTVLSIIEDLLGEDLIYEEECDEVREGRKPVWLRLNPILERAEFPISIVAPAQFWIC